MSSLTRLVHFLEPISVNVLNAQPCSAASTHKRTSSPMIQQRFPGPERNAHNRPPECRLLLPPGHVVSEMSLIRFEWAQASTATTAAEPLLGTRIRSAKRTGCVAGEGIVFTSLPVALA